jgi:hypothetical protein
MLTVRRVGCEWSTEWFVHLWDGSTRWKIDLSQEIVLATGQRISPNGGVTSFADGLVAGGHRVMMEYAWNGTRPHTDAYSVARSTYPVYFMFGLAWGLGRWSPIKDSLRRYVVSAERLSVLTHNGLYYWDLYCSQRVPFRDREIVLRLL